MPKLKYAQEMAATVLRGVWVRVEGPAQRSLSQAGGKGMPGSWEARAEGHGCEQHETYRSRDWQLLVRLET